MFDLPFDFFSLAIAIVGLIVARKAFDQIAVLRARLDLIGNAGVTGSRDFSGAAAIARPRTAGRAIGGRPDPD